VLGKSFYTTFFHVLFRLPLGLTDNIKLKLHKEMINIVTATVVSAMSYHVCKKVFSNNAILVKVCNYYCYCCLTGAIPGSLSLSWFSFGSSSYSSSGTEPLKINETGLFMGRMSFWPHNHRCQCNEVNTQTSGLAPDERGIAAYMTLARNENL